MLTDLGCRRKNNEDSILLVGTGKNSQDSRGVLAIVADGMGGHNAGDVASKQAVATISREYYAYRGHQPVEGLRKAMLQANHALYKEAETNPDLEGMGTTVTALLLQNEFAFFAHVGDTRIYRLHDGNLKQLTEDHTLAAELVKSGVLTQEQVQDFPDRHVLTRAIGTHPQVEVSLSKPGIPVVGGDVFFLCSDGLHDLVQPNEIKRILETKLPQDACEALVNMAKKRGGHDNISVLVLRIVKDQPTETLTTPITRVEQEQEHV